jgi:hypothetical protein
MLRPSIALAATAFAALGLGFAAAPSAAGTHRHQLHIEGALGSGEHALGLVVPWESGHGGSPFDFTGDVDHGDLGVERLRRAWTALQHLPEGQAVTIETRSEPIRATREGGYLVLEPHPGEDLDRSRIKIPDYIVNAVIAHDGRLTNDDINGLLETRGTVTLVKIKSRKGDLSVWIDRAKDDDEDE